MAMTQKELDDSLQGVIFQLLQKADTMFYGFFISEVNKYFSSRVETAGLGKHPAAGIPQMIFNPEFWEKLNNKQRKFLVLHETEHYIHEHYSFTKLFGLERPLDNIAYDLMINTWLMNSCKDIEFIKGGMLPDVFPELKMEPMKSSIYYYNIIKAAKDKKESSKGSQDSLALPKGNKAGSSGSAALDGMLDRDEASKMHTTWEELTKGMSDLEKEVLRRKVSAMVKRSAEECEKSRGTVPAHLSEIIGKEIDKIESVVPWKHFLRVFIGSSMSTEVRTTRKRPNFRFPDAPSLKYKQKVKGIVLCDSSGSMSDYDMAEINSEMYHVYKAGAKIDYASWDAECEPHKPYDGKLMFERTKCGGTRLGCAIEYVNENYRKGGWNFAIIGTDGYVESDPPVCKIPCLIIITQTGSSENLNTPHKVIQLP